MSDKAVEIREDLVDRLSSRWETDIHDLYQANPTELFRAYDKTEYLGREKANRQVREEMIRRMVAGSD